MTIAHSTAESQAFLEEGGRISYEFLAAGRMGAGTDGWGRCFHGPVRPGIAMGLGRKIVSGSFHNF